MGKVLFTTEKLVKYRQHQRNVIGASRQSLFEPCVFLAKIRALIDFFEKNPVPNDRFDLKKLARFCDAYSQKRFCQLSYLGYYLFIHPDSLKGRVQAIFECLLPRLYHAISERL